MNGDHSPLATLYQGQILNLGHRGASAHRPENTLSAFCLAMQQGADGVELDVWLSADGVPVVIHDQHLERTTSGTGLVTALPVKALQAMDAGNGEHIPTLDEVFTVLPDHAVLNIEIKSARTEGDSEASDTPDIEQAVLSVIQAHQAWSRVIISSFDPAVLKRVRVLNSTVALGYLTAPDLNDSEALADIAYQAVHPHYSEVDADYVARVHQQDKRINVWTVNDPALMTNLCQLGVDAIITNKPDLLHGILHSYR